MFHFLHIYIYRPWFSQLWTIGSWWNVRHLPNIMLIHYNELKSDLPKKMKEIAEFLEIEYDESKFDMMVNNCSIEAMRNKKNPMGARMEENSGIFKDTKKFFNKGINGRWKDVLTDKDTENYRHLARRYLDEDGIYWMETGQYN